MLKGEWHTFKGSNSSSYILVTIFCWDQLFKEKQKPELKIKRGKTDNLGTIFHITPLKHVVISLELSHRDGSNEGSQHMFLPRNKKNYFLIIPNTLSYLEI